MIRAIPIFLLFLAVFSLLPAQQTPEESYFFWRQKGLDAMETGLYQDAIKSFKVAEICVNAPAANDLDMLIDSAYQGYVDRLNSLVAQLEAEKEKAKREARKANANRLATLATLLAPKNLTQALRVAEAACQMDPHSQAPLALTATFYRQLEEGNYFVSGLPAKPARISEIKISSDGSELMIRQFGEPARVMELGGNEWREWDSPDSPKWLTEAPEDFSSLFIDPKDPASQFGGNYWMPKVYPPSDQFSDDYVSAHSFSPDGKHLLTRHQAGPARLWNQKREQIAILDDRSGRITDAVYSPDGNHILTRSWDEQVWLWDGEGRNGRPLPVPSTAVSAFSFSPDGQKLYLGTTGGQLVVWDFGLKLLHPFEMEGINRKISDFDLHPQKGLLAGNRRGELARVEPGGMAFNFLKGFQDSAIFKCGFFPDNTFYASAYPNGFGILRASVFGYGQTAPHLLKIRKKHQVLSLCRNKTAVWIMVEDTLAELWSSEGVRIQRLAGHPNTVRKAISHDLTGNTLTLAGNEWFLWDLTGAQIANFPHPFPDRPNAQVADGAFSDDGSRILITYFYASPQLFDQSGKLIAGLKGHEIDLGRVAAAFVPGTNQILTVDDSRFRLWDAAGKGEMLFERNKTSETPRRILFAPDGSRFLLIFDNLTELWTAQADSLASFPSNQMFYENFAFSPSGDYFFLPEYAGRWGDPNITPKKIIVLDRNGNRVAEIGSGEQEIKKAMFSPDGKAVYTLTSDGVIRNWPLPEAILDWLDSNPVLPLSDKEKREFGITN